MTPSPGLVTRLSRSLQCGNTIGQSQSPQLLTLPNQGDCHDHQRHWCLPLLLHPQLPQPTTCTNPPTRVWLAALAHWMPDLTPFANAELWQRSSRKRSAPHCRYLPTDTSAALCGCSAVFVTPGVVNHKTIAPTTVTTNRRDYCLGVTSTTAWTRQRRPPERLARTWVSGCPTSHSPTNDHDQLS